MDGLPIMAKKGNLILVQVTRRQKQMDILAKEKNALENSLRNVEVN
jgi:hypothetical protein